GWAVASEGISVLTKPSSLGRDIMKPRCFWYSLRLPRNARAAPSLKENLGMQQRRRLAAAALMVGLATGCAGPILSSADGGPRNESWGFDQLAQTDFNRTITIAMRDNLLSLDRLLSKLYQRNPREWQKNWPNEEAALAHVRHAMTAGAAPEDLEALSDIQILSVALDP